jgi:adenine-specific DNA-methyltransferase
VNALAREEMIDLLLTSYWDKAERAKSYLRRLPAGRHEFLFAVNPKEEGFFLVWQAADKSSVLIATSSRPLRQKLKPRS